MTRHTSPTEIMAAERSAQAMELRKQGLQYREIAERLGYRSDKAAWIAVRRALDRLKTEPAKDLRAIELARLDALTEALWPRATADPPDISAVNALLKVGERRAKLAALEPRFPIEEGENGALEAFAVAIERARLTYLEIEKVE